MNKKITYQNNSFATALQQRYNNDLTALQQYSHRGVDKSVDKNNIKIVM